ncbi:MAG: acetoacetate--CoA ligase [Alphaproteobacteria bacterium]|nr:acetoacetate--CoA ligase [Alphaproteobacteria bacterium]
MQPLWTPSPERAARSHMARFLAHVNREHGLDLADYDALYAWSITAIPAFWQAVWDYTGIRSSAPASAVLGDAHMPGADWFPGARLNFAENLLRFRDDRPALTFVDESGETSALTYAELYDRVARFRHWLDSVGVQPGDRVAGFLPNRPEAVIAMLATTSLGAIWSSCSPDFGFKGVMDRFGQIGPKVLVACDGYAYGGKRFDSTGRIAEVAQAIEAIEHVVFVGVLGEGDRSAVRGQLGWDDALANDASDIAFAQLPFDHPLYIMYSSGTTGVPKCIVHGAGGTLLQHAKELVLHNDLDRDDALFYFTTCGWMMWNWLVSGLFTGCNVVLYDGSPGHPDLDVLWRMAEDVGVTHFGTSPKFLGICKTKELHPGRDHDLSRLKAVLSTGSPLSAELFHWVYDAVKRDVQLASICGGTDIISCFMLGCPTEPVYAGEIQKRGLGMAVEAWRAPHDPVVGEKGELVCVKPFVSMPVSFWNDEDGEKYRKAYFAHYPGVWRHGDFVEITAHGGVIVYGRSDATLNPGGVRIGTAEIYRQVEAMDEVLDSLVIGQQWEDDTRVVLFVVLADDLALDEALEKRIRTQIRTNTTPRHVPARILQVSQVPRTISGKKVELAVTSLVHGEAVANKDAMANPEALEEYANRPELQR